MTFGSPRIARYKGTHVELYRFASKINHVVNGGASKIFNHFIKEHHYQNVITYADLSWSNGNVYSKLGFQFKYNTKPGFYYIIDGMRSHRFNWRKSILKKKKLITDDKITAREAMSNLGYEKIYDSGNSVWEWNEIITSN